MPALEAQFETYQVGLYTPSTEPSNPYPHSGPGVLAGGILSPEINGNPLWRNVGALQAGNRMAIPMEFSPGLDWQDAVRRGLVTRDQLIDALIAKLETWSVSIQVR